MCALYTLGGGVFRIFISQGLARAAVPVFFLASGYLFFKGIESWEWSIYRKKIKKRLKTLVFPYVLWNTIFIIWFGLSLYFSNTDVLAEFFEKRGGLLMYWNCNRYDYTPSINILGWQMWNGAFPINYPLWFIRDLIIINFIAPIIYVIIQRKWCVVLLLFLYILDVWIPFEGFRAEGIFFFSMGAYLMYYNKGIVSEFSNKIIIINIVTVILLILCTYFYKTEYYMYFRRMFCLFGTITFFQIAASLATKKNKIVRWLTKPIVVESSFVVFAAHAIGFKQYFSAGFSKLLTLLYEGGVPLIIYDIAYFVTPIIISLIIIGLYCLLKSFSPKCCSVLTGGRNK